MRIAPVRRTVLGGLAAVVVSLTCAIAATGGPPPDSSAFYLVEPDPRLCPSPLCGGYWVSLVNRERTRCHDGALRPRCYVTRGVDAHRHPLESGIPAGGLARAAIEPWSFEGLGKLGVLVVADVWAPAGRSSSGGIYRLRDNLRRCVRAPCFWINGSLVNTGVRTPFSSVDLSRARLTRSQLESAGSAIASRAGLFAAGRAVSTADGGRAFRAQRVFLEP